MTDRIDIVEPGALALAFDTGLVARLTALRAVKSTAVIARETGLNHAYISLYGTPKFPGNLTRTEAQLREYFEQLDAMSSHPAAVVVATKGVKAVHGFVSYLRKASTGGLIRGRSGLGKTTALNAYCSANPMVLRVNAASWSGHKGALESAVWQLLRIQGKPGVSRSAGIVERLSPQRVLLVDNAQRLSAGALGWILDVHNEVEMSHGKGLPVVLVEVIHDREEREPDKVPSCLRKLLADSQLSSRFRQVLTMPEDREGLEATADAMLAQALPAWTGELTMAARRIARAPGHLRVLQGLLACTAANLEQKAYAGQPLAALAAAEATTLSPVRR